MATLTFRRGSTPHILHTHFASGQSITYDEALAKGIRNLVQRIHDLNKKFEDAEVQSPLMVHNESNGRGGVHARYFYKGYGCPLENRSDVRAY